MKHREWGNGRFRVCVLLATGCSCAQTGTAAFILRWIYAYLGFIRISGEPGSTTRMFKVAALIADRPTCDAKSVKSTRHQPHAFELMVWAEV